MKKCIATILLGFYMVFMILPVTTAASSEANVINQYRTISAGDYYSLAIKADGTLWSWEGIMLAN